ncbi:dopamine receptor D1AlphaHom-like protein, partial [Leptotrombidium deliense]
MIVGAFVIPPSIIWDILGAWKMGHIFCEIWQTVDVYAATVSLLNMSAISLDRYLAISDPFGYPLKMTKRR